MIPRSGLQKNHDLVLERCVLAAVCMNDRAFGCTTGPDILLTRHFLRCMRVQYEVTMEVLGSPDTFAASVTNGGSVLG